MTRRASLLWVIAVSTVLLSVPPASASTTWNIGDVFVGVANGSYNVYTNDGTFKETISDGSEGGFTTGCSFNPDLSQLYTTSFSAGTMPVYQNASPHPIVDTITPPRGTPESVVFAANGHFFVGGPFNPQIDEYDAAHTLVDSDTVTVADGTGGPDWIDLSADQATMFYATEGRIIGRFNVATDTDLSDFATLPGTGQAFALRLLPPGDGSGGLLVADRVEIKRLDGFGTVVQTYDVAGEDNWFALNLDPNGTSFWSGDFGTNNFYRFNIATGALELGPVASGGALFGICVKGEPTGALPPPGADCPGLQTKGNLFIGTPGPDDMKGTLQVDTMCGLGGNDSIFAGHGNDQLAGNKGNDTLLGSRGGDLIKGGPGKDLLVGGRGNDTLNGGPGFDVCKGGPGKDTFKNCEVIKDKK
ncbi:MAG: hypothetical protein ACRDI0_09670 [Actinomycetota bacterium]